MKVKKTKIVTKEVEEVVEQYHICDKCNTKIETKGYDAFEFELTEGKCYPEGGFGETYSLDLCNNCARGARDLLEENGCKVQKKGWGLNEPR